MEDDILEDREERPLFGEDSEDSSSISSVEEEDERHRSTRLMAINFIAESQATGAMLSVDSSSDSSDEQSSWGGSKKGRAANKARNFHQAKERLMRQYFSGVDSVYDEVEFERRFRMPRSVFMRIKDAVIGVPPFNEKYDAKGLRGIDPLVRLTACLRKMAYGTASDAQDEHFEIAVYSQ